MRNNAAYLPESPIVYIILPKSIRNRASLRIFDLNQKNKIMEQAAFTREELMRRLEEHRRKKKVLIETIQKEMHDRIKERTGEDVTSFNVW